VSRVAVVFTGGTISMKPDAAAGGAVPTLNGRAILARVEGLEAIAEVESIDWGLVPASHLRLGQLLDISRLLAATLARMDVDGIVVVQGTDTIEETAFAYDLLLPAGKPVVVTGAMRNAAEPDYDGPRNLTDSIRCAASDELRDAGTVVVLNGLIIGADQAVKTDTTDFASFQPRDGVVLGEVSDGRVRLTHRAVSRPRLPTLPAAVDEGVHLVTAAIGVDGTLVRLLRGRSPAGLVVAATGAGNTHPDMLAAAGELMDDGTVVCLTTRCWTGSVMPAYAFPGGGAQWQRAGALLSALPASKCRVALALGLAAGLRGEELRRIVRA
jgi:L-asparaginase